jgi:hypothetical protein
MIGYNNHCNYFAMFGGIIETIMMNIGAGYVRKILGNPGVYPDSRFI